MIAIKRGKFYKLELDIIKNYITNKNIKLTNVLTNVFNYNQEYKNICEMLYKKNYTHTKVSLKLNISYQTLLYQKNKMLSFISELLEDFN